MEDVTMPKRSVKARGAESGTKKKTSLVIENDLLHKLKLAALEERTDVLKRRRGAGDMAVVKADKGRLLLDFMWQGPRAERISAWTPPNSASERRGRALHK